MKRILPFLVFAICALQTNAQKLALIEEFTQASCPPCAIFNPPLDAVIHDNETKVVVLKYQVSWPGTDPMNLDNTSDVATRVAYYGVTSAPTALIEGPSEIDLQAIADGNASGFQTSIDNAVAQNAALDVYVSHKLGSTYKSVDFTVVLKNNTADNFVAGNHVLQTALIEKDLQWPSAPGTNGEVEFTYVMKKMFPDANGMVVSTDIAAGDSVVINYSEPLPLFVYDYRELAIVAFVQNNDNRSIVSAGITEPETVVEDGNVGLESTTEAPTEICDPAVIPNAILSNTGMIDLTEVDVVAYLGGDPIDTVNWTGTLAPGASDIVVFSETVVPGGNYALTFRVEKVNTSIDVYTIDSRPAPLSISSLSTISLSDMLLEDNEMNVDNQYPTGAYVAPPIPVGEFGGQSFFVMSRESFGGDTLLGGYGLSDKSIWINFYQWNPAEPNAEDEGSLTFQKLDLSALSSAQISFDRAGARYQGSNDRLQILISTEDCPENWTVVHDIQGADFSTVDGHTEPLYAPTEDQWETDVIDISEYAGIDGVNIQFKAISAWGNSAFLDNIELAGITTGVEKVDPFADRFSINPNPAMDLAEIKVELSSATEMEVSITDISGRTIDVVYTRNQMDQGVNNIDLDVSNFASGLYYVRIQSEIGQSVRKLIVSK